MSTEDTKDGKPKERPPDNPEQSARFISTAKEIGINDGKDAFEAALKILRKNKKTIKNQ